MAAEESRSVERRLVISELLCFLSRKYSVNNVKSLKLVMNDFYSVEDISLAKELLVNSVEKLELDKWPRPPRRKNSDNKSRTEIDDLVNTFLYLDENQLLDRLPIFVALNIDNIPSSKLEEGDLRIMLNKLDKLDCLESTIKSQHEALSVKINELSLQLNKGSTMTVSNRGHIEANSATNWPLIRSTQNLRPPSLMDGIESQNTSEDDGFTTVVSKNASRSKRLRQSSSTDLNASAQPITASHLGNLAPTLGLPRGVPGGNQVQPLPPRRRLIGAKTIDGEGVKAAHVLMKKSVFCVSNVALEADCVSISDFVRSIDVNIVNCFEAKSRNIETKSFRVCICAADVDKFLISASWPANIIVRDWRFKEKVNETNG